MKRILLIAIILSYLVNGLKIKVIQKIDETKLQELTKIKYDSQLGKITSSSQYNYLVYFIQQDQSSQQHKINQQQFQQARTQYAKAVHSQNQKKYLARQQQINHQIEDVQIDNPILLSNQQKQTKKFNFQFIIVKCSIKNQLQQDSQSICGFFGINHNNKQNIIFISQNSQLIHFTKPINLENILYFISKIKENKVGSNNYRIKFDQQLNQLAKIYEPQNLNIKQKTLSFIQNLSRYLSWDILKFILIFIVVPFSFGYVSTKMQQRANRQKLQKYQANLQPEQNKSTSPQNLMKKTKQKTN